MKSRMSKYYENNEYLEETIEIPSRLLKNQDLYKEVSNKELVDFDVNSNSSVLKENVNNSVDIDKIKEMLDRKYRELPKKKSIGEAAEEIGSISLDETREYDINAVIAANHKDRDTNYEEDRLKKLRNTQVDILKDIDSLIGEEEKDDDILEPIDDLDEVRMHREREEKKLKELIDTITAKELISEEAARELDPLDMFSDLKGNNDDTKVLGITNEEEIVDTDENIIDLDDTTEEETIEEETTEVEKVEEKEETTKEEKKEKNLLDTTSTLSFTQSDFDDFNDLKADMRFTKTLIKVLIIIIVIVFIIGCVLLANKMLNLGLF